MAREALQRVQDEVGVSPEVVNVLANLGIVVISAQEPFVRTLLSQPEFSSAVANSDLEAQSAPTVRKAGKKAPARAARAKRRRKT